MNSANNGINDTLKRKNNTIYPEVHGVIEKRKAIANNYDKNKSKQNDENRCFCFLRLQNR